MFPTAPYPKTVFPNFWDLGLKKYSFGKRIFFGQETCPNHTLGKLLGPTPENPALKKSFESSI
jgi:hypothetical protein